MCCFALYDPDCITLYLNVKKAPDKCDVLNYNWELIQGSKMLFGRDHFTGRKNHYLFFSGSYICSVCLGNIIPHSFWNLMFNLTQRSLSSSVGGFCWQSLLEENWNVHVFSHVSKKCKNLNWHFTSNELWTVYCVPKGTTSKLDFC